MAANLKHTKFFMATTNSVVKTTCRWKIEKFSTYSMKLNEFVQSGECKLEIPGDHSFGLRVYPNGCNIYPEISISVLWLKGNFDAKVNKLEIFADDEKIHEQACDVRDFSNSVTEWFFKVIERIQWQQKYPTSDLTVECELEIVRPNCFSTVTNMVPDIFSSDHVLHKVSMATARLFDNQVLVDCNFDCQNEVISAHKAILAAHSSVFEAMFTDDLKEAKTSIVEVEDIEFDVLKEMLRFLYSHETPKNLPEIADQLLIAAEKYLLTDLKSACENYLADNLNTENIRAVLSLATLHNAPRLKQIAVDYAKRNSDQIIDCLLEVSANDKSAIDQFRK